MNRTDQGFDRTRLCFDKYLNHTADLTQETDTLKSAHQPDTPAIALWMKRANGATKFHAKYGQLTPNISNCAK